MVDVFVGLLDGIYQVVWSLPLLLLLLGLGLYLTIALRGLPFRQFGYSFHLLLNHSTNKQGKGDISAFQSLMTALAASLGIGNIVGVATAVTVGGWGAIFWMWVVAVVGMAIKYAESILAVYYRQKGEHGEMLGGPMQFIEKGLGWKSLAVAFALFGSFDALTAGNMIQAHSVSDILFTSYGLPHWVCGLLLVFFTGITLLAGIKGIAKVVSWLVPIMALLYVGAGALILVSHFSLIPVIFGKILSHAFTGQAMEGGFVGATILVVIQTGISRGLMTSEAGLGTASIASAAAKTEHPARQALISMLGSFVATMVLCTMTALVLGVTDVFGTLDESGRLLTGAPLTSLAFSNGMPFGDQVVLWSLLFFAYTTILGWAYYGEKCTEYLLGVESVRWYRFLFISLLFPATMMELPIVWKMADVCNGLMAIPNLIGIAALSPVILRETRRYFSRETESLTL